jgi:hypothetical protein
MHGPKLGHVQLWRRKRLLPIAVASANLPPLVITRRASARTASVSEVP